MPRLRKASVARGVLGAVLAALGAATAAFLYAGRLLLVADPLPRTADAIVILAGSVPDRTLEAADLYHAGIASRVIVTREEPRRGDPALHARGVFLPENDDLTLTALAQLGVPPSAIVHLRRRCGSTTSEARTIARYACRHGLERLVVVTSRIHTRRARLILRRTLGPRVAVAVRPSRYDTFSPTRWWRVRSDAKLLWWEYEKLANYWLHDRWTIAPCGGLKHPKSDEPRRDETVRDPPPRAPGG